MLRVGGNVLTPRGTVTANRSAIDAVSDLVAAAVQDGVSVTVLPGGVGGHLFLEWARSVGCPDAVMNDIGCSLIDIGAAILADYFARRLPSHGVSCPPRAARTYPDLVTLHNDYPVVVSGACVAGTTTSDSLALILGEARGVPVLSVKRSLPFSDMLEPVAGPDCTARVRLQDISGQILSGDLVEKAGFHPSLDAWSLRLLRRPGVSLSITTLAALKEFSVTGDLSPVIKVRNE